MQDPAREVTPLIYALTQGTPSQQRDVLQAHFLPDASFVHPFCRVPRFSFRFPLSTTVRIDSRDFILAIFRWYKFLSPNIEIEVDSVQFDERVGRLYVAIRQTFRLWFVPAYSAPVHLVTVLKVEKRQAEEAEEERDSEVAKEREARRSKIRSPDDHASASTHVGAHLQGITSGARIEWMIAEQNDLYQVNDWLNFLVPNGIGPFVWSTWQVVCALLCAVCWFLAYPVWSFLGMAGWQTGRGVRGL